MKLTSTCPEVLELAAKAGVAHTTVFAYLCSARKPRRSTVRLIHEAAEALGLTHLLPVSANATPGSVP